MEVNETEIVEYSLDEHYNDLGMLHKHQAIQIELR